MTFIYKLSRNVKIHDMDTRNDNVSPLKTQNLSGFEVEF